MKWIAILLSFLLTLSSSLATASDRHGQSLSIMRMPEIEAVRDDPSCPPINKYTIAQQLQPIFLEGNKLDYRYRLQFTPTPLYQQRLQKYLQYIQSLETSINTITTTWRIFDKGEARGRLPPSSPGLGAELTVFSSRYNNTQKNHSVDQGRPYVMVVNHWYRVLSATTLNSSKRFFPRKCETAQYWINWQLDAKQLAGGGPDGTVVVSDGRKVMAYFPIDLNN